MTDVLSAEELVKAVPGEYIEKRLLSLGDDTFAGIVRTCDLPVPFLRSIMTELLHLRSHSRASGVKGQWYLGSQNDGLFIIDTPPRPSNDDAWHDRPDGPSLVIPLGDMPKAKAQAIVDAHNASIQSCLVAEGVET